MSRTIWDKFKSSTLCKLWDHKWVETEKNIEGIGKCISKYTCKRCNMENKTWATEISPDVP